MRKETVNRLLAAVLVLLAVSGTIAASANDEPRIKVERSDLPYTKRSGDMVYTSWLD